MVFLLLHRIASLVISAYISVLFVRMILDWVLMLSPYTRFSEPWSTIVNAIYALTEPPLRWLRRYIKPLPLGAIYLDISFIVLYVILLVLQILL